MRDRRSRQNLESWVRQKDGPSGTEANTSPATTAASPTGTAEAPTNAVSRCTT
jgi:hypothetical protein